VIVCNTGVNQWIQIAEFHYIVWSFGLYVD
jgi:hypothetical protein